MRAHIQSTKSHEGHTNQHQEWLALMDSPYRGLVPYNEEDALFFCGREAEIRLVVANICSTQLTLLYGPSGVGKSSILRAGVTPKFRTAQYASIPIYFNRWKGDPLINLEEAIIEAIQKESISDPEGKDLVADCLKQIETQRSTLDSLAGIIEIAATALKRRLVVILDQFDEYFLYQPEPHADRFGPVLAATLALPKSQVSFLLSLRNDSLSELDRFEGDIPILFDNYLRLEHLDREAARKAITEPLKKFKLPDDSSGQDREVQIEPQLVEAVLDELSAPPPDADPTRKPSAADTRIRPSDLQLVMTRLWQEDVVRGRGRTLRRDTLQKLGGLKKIARNHLNEVMRDLSWGQRRLATRLFRWIVSSSGKKVAETPNRLAELAHASPTKTINLLERLEQLRILNSFEVRAEDGTGEKNYEIYHSFLAQPIIEWRHQYRLKVRIVSIQLLLAPPVIFVIAILTVFRVFDELSDLLYFAGVVLILLAPLYLGFLIGRWWERAK